MMATQNHEAMIELTTQRKRTSNVRAARGEEGTDLTESASLALLGLGEVITLLNKKLRKSKEMRNISKYKREVGLGVLDTWPIPQGKETTTKGKSESSLREMWKEERKKEGKEGSSVDICE